MKRNLKNTLGGQQGTSVPIQVKVARNHVQNGSASWWFKMVAHEIVPRYYGSFVGHTNPFCLTLIRIERLQTKVPIEMTLHSELHHSLTNSTGSAVPSASTRAGFCPAGRRRLTLPDSPQAGTCLTSNLTLQTSTG